MLHYIEEEEERLYTHLDPFPRVFHVHELTVSCCGGGELGGLETRVRRKLYCTLQ